MIRVYVCSMKIKKNFTVQPVSASGRAEARPPAQKTILVPIDFSESSVKALRHAAAMAEKEHACLTLVNVVDEPHSFRTLDAEGEQREEEKRRVERLEQLARREVHPNQSVHLEVREGNAPREIVRLAGRQNADLIVVGLHEWRGIKRWFHRNVAARILREACCPVLMLKDYPG